MKEKLKKRYEKELKVINQPVYIRDIFVYKEIDLHENDEYKYSLTLGETRVKSKHYHQINIWRRIIDHIELLANIAARTHEHYHCQPSSSGFEIKEDCQNNITRISTSEFSFYKDTPFTLYQFSILIKEMELMAQKYYDNMHLLVSSLPIVTDDKTVVNVCLYIQCGKNPIVSCFTKAQSSSIDPTFPETKLFSQRNIIDKPKQFTAKMEDKSSTSKELVISNQSIIKIKTLGGAVYTQAVDICLDYLLEQARKIIIDELNYSPSVSTDFFPLRADHLISSNSISLQPQKNITSAVIVDPRMTKIEMRMPCSDTSFLSSADLNLPPPIRKRKPLYLGILAEIFI